jgi:hypothetical protein
VHRGFLALFPLAWLVTSCSVALSPGEEQCDATEDCAARGFKDATCKKNVCVARTHPVDPIWGCLGNLTEPVADPTKTVELAIRLAFATDGSALPPDALVDVCDKLDIGCTGVNPDFPKGLHPATDGVVVLTLREGFDGFVRITQRDIVDSRVYVGRPIVVAPKVGEVQLLRPTEYATLAIIATKPVDPERGTAILLAVDCAGDAVRGVRFECPSADENSQEFYLINQAPVIPPSATATDGDGFGGFFNLVPSSAVARGFRDEDDAYIGEASFQVLADTISYVLIAPTPQ